MKRLIKPDKDDFILLGLYIQIVGTFVLLILHREFDGKAVRTAVTKDLRFQTGARL